MVLVWPRVSRVKGVFGWKGIRCLDGVNGRVFWRKTELVTDGESDRVDLLRTEAISLDDGGPGKFRESDNLCGISARCRIASAQPLEEILWEEIRVEFRLKVRERDDARKAYVTRYQVDQRAEPKVDPVPPDTVHHLGAGDGVDQPSR